MGVWLGWHRVSLFHKDGLARSPDGNAREATRVVIQDAVVRRAWASVISRYSAPEWSSSNRAGCTHT